MSEIEFIAKVRDFIEQGGDVLFAIAIATAIMWTLIYERFYYFRTLHRKEVERIRQIWEARSERRSWEAGHIRRMLISDVRLKLVSGLGPIQTLIKVAPMLGLLGTVTGMIEVFDVMAGGSGNARGMAAGVSKATLPTMAGMVAAISGMIFSVQLMRFSKDEAERVADSLETDH